jgi:hypothetical protein
MYTYNRITMVSPTRSLSFCSRVQNASTAIDKASKRSALAAFLLAGSDLDAVLSAHAALEACCLALGAAASVAGARNGNDIAKDVKEILSGMQEVRSRLVSGMRRVLCGGHWPCSSLATGRVDVC